MSSPSSSIPLQKSKLPWGRGSGVGRPGSAPAQLQSRAGDQRRPPAVQVEGPA